MNESVTRIITRTGWVAGALAVVLSPVPLADELMFLPVFGVMTARIGKANGLAARDIPWRPIASTMLATLAARATLNVAVSYIPGVAAAANAVSAVTVTRLLGRYVDEACADPAAAHPLSVREAATRLKDALIPGRAAPRPA